MAFLIDTGWMQVIIGAVALFVTIVLYLRARARKSLTYEVVSEYPLISVDDEIKGKLQILFNGEAIENVHLLSIKFTNDGNVPIAGSDYERPLTLSFEGESNLLSAEFVKGNPHNLIASLKVENKVIELEPVLMNGGDFFSAKLLIGQYSGKFDIDARIIGVKSIRRRQLQTEWYSRHFNALVFTAIIFMSGTLSTSYYLYNIRHSDELNRELLTRELVKLIDRPTIVAITLSPSISRENGAIPIIKRPEGVPILRLQLLLQEDNYQSYRAEIHTEEGKTLFTTDGLSIDTQGSSKIVIINLPASIIPVGDYRISLGGKTSDGRMLSISSYYFRVTDT